MNDIDLPPNRWKSDRPKPPEPFWGLGAGPFFMIFVPQFVIAVLLAHYFVIPLLHR